MRKQAVIVFVLVLVMLLSSCSDVYEETVISDIALYDTIWSLSEKRITESSVLFPTVVNDEQVIKFNCKHTTYQLLGTGWQVELVIQYDATTFSIEHKRLSESCKNSIVCGRTKYFDNLTYATVWNWNSCFEYAVVNEDDSTIGYIYLQLIDKNDLAIDNYYIPKQYEMIIHESQEYSVY